MYRESEGVGFSFASAVSSSGMPSCVSLSGLENEMKSVFNFTLNFKL